MLGRRETPWQLNILVLQPKLPQSINAYALIEGEKGALNVLRSGLPSGNKG